METVQHEACDKCPPSVRVYTNVIRISGGDEKFTFSITDIKNAAGSNNFIDR